MGKQWRISGCLQKCSWTGLAIENDRVIRDVAGACLICAERLVQQRHAPDREQRGSHPQGLDAYLVVCAAGDAERWAASLSLN